MADRYGAKVGEMMNNLEVYIKSKLSRLNSGIQGVPNQAHAAIYFLYIRHYAVKL